MPTIRDVAERAGVSPITVSRVINHSGYVSQETRARVEAAIAELQYVPNSLARSLRFKRTHTLALVLTDITNPFWTTVARGVEDVASQSGFNVILCNTDESDAKQSEYLNVLLQKQVDGFLLVPARSAPEPITLIQSQRVPTVVLDRQVPGAQVDVVRGDSEGGAYQLVRLLLSLGHRRIAMLSGPVSISTAADRVAGYRRALQEAGLEAQAELVCYGEYTQESGYQMAQEALSLTPRPTALFAANNFIAIGALRALRETGVRVPEDMALVSFDDIPPAFAIEPFLTVAAQPAYEMGRRATELLLARLSGQAPPEPQEIVFPTEIIVRRSSGPPVKFD
ncbi:MAG: LacI family DNA-binding transcriptional regulator [Anaerolineae bacterium]|nr:LacI family transcriptional regulator [Anaerolineae bacterium]MDW8099207.1 LacI family DNA-binding transcriptional regulator [Anaerolineae bacterium]